MTRNTRLSVEALEDRRTPSFTPAGSYTVGTEPQSLVAADFNNDGRLDLATANAGDDTVTVVLGNGDGTFQPAQTSAAGDNPFSLAVGDFNDDGTMDLTAGSGGGGVVVMFGNRDGTFRPPTPIAVGYPTVESVATGDFNRDGKMDIVVTSNYRPPDYSWYPQGRADVLLAIGDGSFATPRMWGWPDRALGDAVVADMNGDGNPDLVTELADYSSIIVVFGDGLGNLGGSRGTEAHATHPSAAGDLNGDEKIDLVTSGGVLWGDGTGGFASWSPEGPVTGWGPGSVVLGDFDRDGGLDVATAGGLLRNAGNGTFSGGEPFPAGSGGSTVAAGDFNGDGWLDVATANPSGNTVSVLVNDQAWSPPLPTISVGGAMVTEGDAGTVNATFTLTLSKPSDVDVTVHYETADGGAVAGSDYVASSGDVTIPAGQTSATFTAAVLGDRLPEPTESFSVRISNAANATIVSGQAYCGILDDEPRISIGNGTVTEGSAGTVNATFTLTLSKPSDVDVTAHYETADGGAVAGSDYVAASADVLIPAGQTSATVTVAVLGDRLFEPTEYFSVNLSSAANAWIDGGWALGTILDDEPRLSINNVTKYEGNGKTTTFTFTVRLSAPYDQPVTVNYATADGTATVGNNDYVAKSGTLTFAPGETTKTITVVVNGDKTKEANETFFVNLSGASGNALLLDAQGIGTIFDDDR